MPNWSSYLTRFLLLLLVCVLAMTATFFGVSSYLFNEISTSGHYTALTESLRAAEKLLADYQAGNVTQEEVRAAVNPVLNGDGNFYMLMDADFQVVAYTDAAAPYFAGDSMKRIASALKEAGSALVRDRGAGTLALMIAKKTDAGYALAGKTLRGYSGTAFSFRNQLMFFMGLTLLVVLLLSVVAARKVSRPARMITETASRLAEGEQVLLPENLPGEEMREIARAFNHLSRKVAEAIQALRYEKETMALVLEGLSEGVLALDNQGAVLHENAAARRLLGENTPAYAKVMAALQENAASEQWEGKTSCGDRVLHYAVNRLPQEKGGRRGTVALIRDITEEERLERTRYDYVANISHELRTPLASMRGLAEGLRDGMVTEERDKQRYYHMIVDEVTRLSRLVNDLLELSSLQSNPAAFEMERVDPNELIYDLHDRNGSLFREKDLRFERQLPAAPLPDIISNEDRLAQVLTIFLDNARKYTPAGGSVYLGAEEAAGGVRFFVRDTGVGMDAETQRLAFERFHQAERGRSDKGSGLGLSIAREILQKMQVTIAVESAPGQGSCFSFVIKNPEKTGDAAAD